MLDSWQDAARPTARIGRVIEAHERIGSTNDRARALLATAGADGLVVVAEEQTAGRGRRGRTWLSPPGLNLMLSVALEPRLAAADAWQLGLAAALAALGACRAHAPAGLKWPNDLVADDGRKLGGLLVETMADGDRLAGAIVGVGINGNWPRGAMPEEIAAGATSLLELSGEPVDRVALLRRLLLALEDELARIEGGEPPTERYRAACTTLGAVVSVATPEGVIRGRAVDLDDGGRLVVETESGPQVLSTGEVLRVARAVPA